MGYKGYVNTEWVKPPRKWIGRSWDDFLPNYYADTTGWMENIPLIIVATGPSMDQIPNVWEKLRKTNVPTVGINHVLKMFDPTFWTAWDREYFSKKYDKWVKAFTGIPIWEWRYSAAKHRSKKRLFAGTRALAEDADVNEAWAHRGMGGMIPAGQSDCFALEIFSGMMHASPVYLLGVDYYKNEESTQCAPIWDLMPPDRKHLSNINMGRFADTYKDRNVRYHEAALRRADENEREIYTCSPDEKSMSRDTFEYMPFENALEEAEEKIRHIGERNVVEALNVRMQEHGVDGTWGSFVDWSNKTHGEAATAHIIKAYAIPRGDRP